MQSYRTDRNKEFLILNPSTGMTLDDRKPGLRIRPRAALATDSKSILSFLGRVENQFAVGCEFCFHLREITGLAKTSTTPRQANCKKETKSILVSTTSSASFSFENLTVSSLSIG